MIESKRKNYLQAASNSKWKFCWKVDSRMMANQMRTIEAKQKKTEKNLMSVHFTDFKSNKLKYENEKEKTIIQIDKYAKCIWQYRQQ